MGIAVKRLDGWEPVTVAEHEYDDDGRLIRTVTRREPEWDEESRTWAEAWLVYKSQIHEACGHYLPDSTEAAAEYEVGDATRCHACTARSIAFKRYEDSPQNDALLYMARPKR